MPGSAPFNQLGWDPHWKTPAKQNSSDPNKAILWSLQGAGQVYRSLNCGQSWLPVPDIGDPPNTFNDSPAPVLSDVNFIQRLDSIHQNGLHILISEWQEAGGDWRGALARTDDDGKTGSWSWKSLGDAPLSDGTYYYAVYENFINHAAGVVTIAGTGGIGLEDGSYATLTRQDSNYCVSSIVLDMGAVLTGTGMTIQAKACHNLMGGSCPYDFWLDVNDGTYISLDGVTWTRIDSVTKFWPNNEIPNLAWGPIITYTGVHSFRYIRYQTEYASYNPGT